MDQNLWQGSLAVTHPGECPAHSASSARIGTSPNSADGAYIMLWPPSTRIVSPVVKSLSMR